MATDDLREIARRQIIITRANDACQEALRITRGQLQLQETRTQAGDSARAILVGERDLLQEALDQERAGRRRERLGGGFALALLLGLAITR